MGLQNPSFDILPSGSTSPEMAVQSLIRNGAVIIRDFVEPKTMKVIEDDVRPFIDQASMETCHNKTRYATGLAARSRTFMEHVAMHPLWVAVADALLYTRSTMWMGQEKVELESRSQISANTALCVGPGAIDQPLHRDDAQYFNDVPATTVDKYEIGRERMLICMVACRRTTKQNGATRFIPGTHLQATSQPPPAVEDGVQYAELEPGDAFIILGSCIHGASANHTNGDRLIVATARVHSYLRQVFGFPLDCLAMRLMVWPQQEENQYLTIPRETLLSYPLETQKNLGYSMAGKFVGWVDLQEPYLAMQCQ
jgi:ectoine hydroxylase-related dioxygenase (phytanoyl-CoA dioxygenase family)